MNERGGRGPEHKFAPARADRLDAPERDAYLPDAPLLDHLGLHGDETVVDYGAGTGRLAIAVRALLGAGGRVVAVEENEEMLGRLRERVAAAGAQVEAVAIASNRVPEPDGGVDRVLAVNLLHEVRGERALEEMRRLVGPDGLLLVADWGSAAATPSERSGLRTRSSTARQRPPPSSSVPDSRLSPERAFATTSCCSAVRVDPVRARAVEPLGRSPSRARLLGSERPRSRCLSYRPARSALPLPRPRFLRQEDPQREVEKDLGTGKEEAQHEGQAHEPGRDGETAGDPRGHTRHPAVLAGAHELTAGGVSGWLRIGHVRICYPAGGPPSPSSPARSRLALDQSFEALQRLVRLLLAT